MVTSRRLAVVLAAALLGCASYVAAQKTTIRHHRVAESDVSPQVVEAEKAIDGKDYPKAESLLNDAVKAAPTDYRAWFDLGLVYSATARKPDAVEAYRKSVAAKPDFFESNLDLGLLLAEQGDAAESAKYLQAATQLKPSDPAHAERGMFLAWDSLGRVLEGSSPQQALDAYRYAVELQPGNLDLHLRVARLLEKKPDLPAAEAEYQKAAKLDPKSEEALRGLTNVYITEGKVSEAEKALTAYLQVDPSSAQAHLQLARIYSSAHNYDGALTELESAQKLKPDDTEIQREIAGNAAIRGKYDLAEAAYRGLLKDNPQDAGLHYGLGTALMNEHKFPAAEVELFDTVKLNPKLAEAYGNLATVAAENQHYPLAIQALDARGALLPENAGSYFLRASCLDHLHQYKKAAQNYRMFLSVADGKFPNQEWQAKHRLLAIDPK